MPPTGATCTRPAHCLHRTSLHSRAALLHAALSPQASIFLSVLSHLLSCLCGCGQAFSPPPPLPTHAMKKNPSHTTTPPPVHTSHMAVPHTHTAFTIDYLPPHTTAWPLPLSLSFLLSFSWTSCRLSVVLELSVGVCWYIWVSQTFSCLTIPWA